MIAHATKMVALARSRQYMHIFPIDASRNSPVTILSQIIIDRLARIYTQVLYIWEHSDIRYQVVRR